MCHIRQLYPIMKIIPHPEQLSHQNLTCNNVKFKYVFHYLPKRSNHKIDFKINSLLTLHVYLCTPRVHHA
jgi:hypothetical protein